MNVILFYFSDLLYNVSLHVGRTPAVLALPATSPPSSLSAENNSVAAEKAKVAVLEDKFSVLLAEKNSLASENDRLRVELDGMRSVISLTNNLKEEIWKLKEAVAVKDKIQEDTKTCFEMEKAGLLAQNDRLEKDLVDMLKDRMQDIEQTKNACLANVDAQLSMTKMVDEKRVMMKSIEDMKKEISELRSQLNKCNVE